MQTVHRFVAEYIKLSRVVWLSCVVNLIHDRYIVSLMSYAVSHRMLSHGSVSLITDDMSYCLQEQSQEGGPTGGFPGFPGAFPGLYPISCSA